jgi:hypothetical protein
MMSIFVVLAIASADPLSLTYSIVGGIIGAMRRKLWLALTLAAMFAIVTDIIIWLYVRVAIPMPMTDAWRLACHEREWLHLLGLMVREAGTLFFPARIVIGLLVGYVAYRLTPVAYLHRNLREA